MADDMTNTAHETHPTHDPDRQRRIHRIPFLVAGAVAGLVFGVGAALPVWSAPAEWRIYRDDPPPPNWDGYSDSRGTLLKALAVATSHPSALRRVWNDDNVALWVLLTACVVAAGAAAYGLARWIQEWEAAKHLDLPPLPPPSRPDTITPGRPGSRVGPAC